MDATHYITVALFSINIGCANAAQHDASEIENDHVPECTPLLSDSHKLLITQCESINLSASTERGDSIVIESKGTGNSIVIRMGSTDDSIDTQESINDDSTRQEKSEAELIERLLKRRDLSPKAIQRHIDRIKERKLKNTKKRSECIEGQNCIDVKTEYPIDELKLESSK